MHLEAACRDISATISAIDPKEPLAIQVNRPKITGVFFLLLLVLPQYSAAYTCSDSSLTLEEMFEQYDLALIGTVEKKFFDLRLGSNSYLVTIQSIKKGKVSADQLVVWTRPGRCGAKFKNGESIVLFLEEDGGKYWANYFSYWEIVDQTQRHTQEYEDFVFDND